MRRPSSFGSKFTFRTKIGPRTREVLQLQALRSMGGEERALLLGEDACGSAPLQSRPLVRPARRPLPSATRSRRSRLASHRLRRRRSGRLPQLRRQPVRIDGAELDDRVAGAPLHSPRARRRADGIEVEARACRRRRPVGSERRADRARGRRPRRDGCRRNGELELDAVGLPRERRASATSCFVREPSGGACAIH